jgi:hypothetical protein
MAARTRIAEGELKQQEGVPRRNSLADAGTSHGRLIVTALAGRAEFRRASKSTLRGRHAMNATVMTIAMYYALKEVMATQTVRNVPTLRRMAQLEERKRRKARFGLRVNGQHPFI